MKIWFIWSSHITGLTYRISVGKYYYAVLSACADKKSKKTVPLVLCSRVKFNLVISPINSFTWYCTSDVTDFGCFRFTASLRYTTGLYGFVDNDNRRGRPFVFTSSSFLFVLISLSRCIQTLMGNTCSMNQCAIEYGGFPTKLIEAYETWLSWSDF